MTRNILLIMCDQLRADYLSCEGHPTLQTPNIDKLAARGVRFTQAYIQAPICGPSRTSFYTGRYMSSHGSTWNWVPMPVGERTLGDFLRPHGYRVAVTGKTHVAPDIEGMRRLGIDPASKTGSFIAQGGFEPFARHDGVHATPKSSAHLAYNDFLRAHGYNSENPWQDYANSVTRADGSIASGWHLRNAGYPSRVRNEHSETAFITDRAIDFIRQQGDQPWCLHLSYIKPHWPYVASEPYHRMFDGDDCLSAHRVETERDDPHPVYQAFMNNEVSQAFSRDEVRRTVVPTYMGLVKQIDDHLGRLFTFLESELRMADTLVVFTSDHGDYLGDHFLGEKELFHDCVTRIPLILYDPDPAADPTRGSVNDTLVEAIDLLPTFLEACALEPVDHILEGESLIPLVRGLECTRCHDDVFSELDYAYYDTRRALGLEPSEARSYMIRTREWKYIDHRHFRPQLFDLKNDPGELVDLGNDSSRAKILQDLSGRLLLRLQNLKRRVTESNATVDARTDAVADYGIYIGRW
ncbi:MAG TPA: phosphonate monoester hydrolase [Acidobacteria bacterium]|nr:phosphonate monoester hydrolase [Acidobacteriota bacterium]